MSSLQGLLLRQGRSVVVVSSQQRFARGPFHKPPRSFEDRNRATLELYKDRRLKLSEPIIGKPHQFRKPELEKEPRVERRERKLLPLAEEYHQYDKHSEEDIKNIEYLGDYYDPLFNPHLHEKRHSVDPNEEPFNAIYKDSQSEGAQQYTKVRDITNPELWAYVERLQRIQIAPLPGTRKANEQVKPMPSGYVPPPESPPDLPYFVMRTRNYLLPVYYHLDDEPDKCYTTVTKVSGDLWKFEQDVRTFLQSLGHYKRRILSSVHETDGTVSFRGKHLHEVVDWLHEKGF